MTDDIDPEREISAAECRARFPPLGPLTPENSTSFTIDEERACPHCATAFRRVTVRTAHASTYGLPIACPVCRRHAFTIVHDGLVAVRTGPRPGEVW